MTAALVGGLGLLIYGMVTRTASLGDGDRPFGTVDLSVPPGTTIETIVADQGLIYLHLAAPGGERILVLDGRTGQQMGEVTLTPGAP